MSAPVRPSKPERLSLLGAEVDVLTVDDVLDFTAGAIRSGRGGLVANHNLHSLHLIGRDRLMREVYAGADLIEIDSMPLIAWARLMGHKVGRQNRLTYLDWREAFWTRAASEGWRVFHLGCRPGITERATAAILARHPGVSLGGRHGYFDLDGPDNAEVLAEIAAFRPDVLFVGMGMPRQEGWIARNRAALGPVVIFPIGAAFDYEAEAVPTPPRLAGRLGLEWAFRLAAEPGRLAHRYLVEPWSLVPAALGDLRQRLAAKTRSAAGEIVTAR